MQIDSSRSSKTREEKNHALKALLSNQPGEEGASVAHLPAASGLRSLPRPAAHEQIICNIWDAHLCLRKR